MSVERLKREQTQLLVIDVQERLCAAMPPERLARMLNRTHALLEGAKALGLPVTLTEQYPKGLGPTLASVRERAAGAPAFEKVEFSALVPAVSDRLAGRPQVLVAGMEAHICVFQTVRDLAGRGLRPVLCADAVISRAELDERLALESCREAGARITTTEAALFDLLGCAGTPEFKAISAAIK